MPERSVLLKRDELYALVWSVPLVQLAKRYGLSDRGLGKICHRMEVPLPGVGYWAKVAAGQQTKKKPLPPLTAKGVAEHRVEVPTPRRDMNLPALCQDPAQYHPMVQQTLKALAYQPITPNQKYLKNDSAPHLHVDVRPEALERALRILDYLIKQLESKNIGVSIKKGRDGFESWLKVEREECSIYLYESPHVAYGRNYDPATILYSSSGDLSLEVNNCGRVY
jgi:hypothetical protein